MSKSLKNFGLIPQKYPFPQKKFWKNFPAFFFSRIAFRQWKRLFPEKWSDQKHLMNSFVSPLCSLMQVSESFGICCFNKTCQLNIVLAAFVLLFDVLLKINLLSWYSCFLPFLRLETEVLKSAIFHFLPKSKQTRFLARIWNGSEWDLGWSKLRY